jgi:hypothetical protein
MAQSLINWSQGQLYLSYIILLYVYVIYEWLEDEEIDLRDPKVKNWSQKQITKDVCNKYGQDH